MIVGVHVGAGAGAAACRAGAPETQHSRQPRDESSGCSAWTRSRIGESTGARSSGTGSWREACWRERAWRSPTSPRAPAALDRGPRPMHPTCPRRAAGRARSAQPNILVIVVDQLRFPQWLSAGPLGGGLPPNIAALAEGGVSFVRHYTASNDCAPARSTLLTGLLQPPDRLHDHRRQHARPRISDVGHDAARTRLPHLVVRQVASHPSRQLLGAAARIGGARALRLRRRHLPLARRGARPGLARGCAKIERQFAEWFAREGDAEPWCTTVSFVNPHDIAWWYRWTKRVPAERTAPSVARRLPPNFETPAAA